jgi:hypothetical protein
MNKKLEDDTNYISPLFALIFYKIGSFNNFDMELIDYCHKIGLDTETSLAIYLAQKKEDVEHILSHWEKNYYTHLMNIRKLKKLSAEKKFRMDYGINTDEQLTTLLSKQKFLRMI